MAASLAKIDTTRRRSRSGAVSSTKTSRRRPGPSNSSTKRRTYSNASKSLLTRSAVQQATSGIVQGVGSIGYELQDLQNQSGLTLDELSAVLDAQRAQSLEAAGTAVQQDAASLQAAADMMRLTSAEIESFLADIAAAQQDYLNAAAAGRG